MKKFRLSIIIVPLLLLFTLISRDSYSQDPEDDQTLNTLSKPNNVTTSLPNYGYNWETVSPDIRSRSAFKRFEWFYRTRINEHGDFPKDFINSQKEIEMQKLQSNDYSTSDLWTNIGPVGINMSTSFIPYWGVNSGRERGIDIHPTNPNILYVGAAAGGIWKSTDGGNTWTDKSNGLNLLTFGAIAIDPVNPNIIYAGTGETIWQANNVTYEGDGLYKSTDGGDTWTHITNGFGAQTQFSSIKISPTNSNILLASLAAGNWNNNNPVNKGVWRSDDAGNTWTKVIDNTGAFDVAFSPFNGNLAYAGIGDQNATGGFLISTDAGLTWNQSNSGLPGTSLIGRIQFDISRSNPSVIYCIINNSGVISGNKNTCAYKSTNGGASWGQISTGVNISGTFDGTADVDQGNYDLCISVNPVDPNIVFFGNVEISKTTNGSNISFVRNPSGFTNGIGAWDGYTHTDIHRILYSKSNPANIYVCCDGGVYGSTNSGTTFTHRNTGINTIQFYRVASHPTNPNVLFGGAQDNGNFSTADKGATSWVFRSSGDGMECFVDYSNPNNVFMSTQNGSLTRSTDGGITWGNVNGGLPNTAWVAPYWQHPTQPTKIFAAMSQSIFRSTNSGASGSWTNISSTLPGIGFDIITSVAHSPVNTNKLIAVASNYTLSPLVWVSTNEGINWTAITSPLFTGANITRVIADPVNENTFYICRASYTTAQVIKTTDFGTTWTNISNGLPAITANDVFVDPLNNNHIYVGNDFGVYWTYNGGTNWKKLANQFPFVPVLDFSFYSNGGTRYLRAATFGRGVYELNIDQPLAVGGNTTPIPEKYSLSQNYPNPFNPTTKINFALPKSGFVTLKVYDKLGRLVQTLLSENKQAGEYSAQFSGEGLSSGIYFFKLEAGNFSSVRKSVLIK
jgi:photosystem II stability/assembly factor-like uncharacterized protein